MTQKELAARTGLTVQSLNRIIKGKQPITYETANRLELVTNVSANFWNNLEAQYQEQTVKLKERERIEKDIEWLKTIPTNELVKRNLINPCDDKVLLLREALSFYGVSSVGAYNDVWEKPAIAARRSACFDSQPGPASAWIRQGELQAQKTKCLPFDKELFKHALVIIRKITRKTPDVFIPEMISLCAESGVAVALVPEMKKVPWSGATKWLSPTKAMILLNLRGKAEDKFWFSFFHEAGHVLNDSTKDLLINDGTKDDPREVRADEFASESLIPSKFNKVVRKANSKSKIIQLANDFGVSPGIVAGRFQFLTRKWHFYKDLIRRFEWDES